MTAILSLNKPTLQIRDSSIKDEVLLALIRTLVRDIEKQFTDIAATFDVDPYVAVTYATGWADEVARGDAVVGYYRDPVFLCRLKGTAKKTGGTGLITTLIVAPAEQETFVTIGDGALAEVTIGTDGTVTLTSGTAASYLILSGIAFRCADQENE